MIVYVYVQLSIDRILDVIFELVTAGDKAVSFIKTVPDRFLHYSKLKKS